MDSKRIWTAIGIGSVIGALAIGIISLTSKRGGITHRLNRKSRCKKRYLFIGDSLTVYNPSYADQLKSVCKDINYKKIAVGGKRTDWMLNELTNELQKEKYDVITIWGGVNDVYSLVPIEKIKSNLNAMYKMAKRKGAKVVAVTIVPTATYNLATPNYINRTDQINKWIRSNKDVNKVVDAYKVLSDGHKATKPEYLQPDSLHLNSAAHKAIMNEYLRKVI